jgi:hypothetical protein
VGRFLIGITGMGKNPHVPCFLDAAKALAAALRRLGHEVKYADTDERGKGGRLILYGANNLLQAENAQGHEVIPDDAIIFNSEQLAAVADPAYFLQGYLKFRGLTVWDYSNANITAMKKLGIERAVHVPLGYVPEMSTIRSLPYAQQDIDVLHYGSIGDSRRREILDALEATDMNVVKLFGVYGDERDAIIARSKLIVNLHYYERGVFEIFRVSHLLANRKCVVTESGGCDPQLEEFAQKSCEYVNRGQIVETCQTIVKQLATQRFIENRGFDALEKIDFVEVVKRALEQST